MMQKLRLVFMGTPDFACPTLQKLIERGEEILAVVTQPDRPKGRGQQLAAPPVKVLAEKHGIPVMQPLKVRAPEFIDIMRGLQPDLIVVVAFGQILPKALLDIPRYGCINVHASLLPRYRGAAPINWCIINGETETGVTTMQMDVGLDTGDMLVKKTTPIDPDEDSSSAPRPAGGDRRRGAGGNTRPPCCRKARTPQTGRRPLLLRPDAQEGRRRDRLEQGAARHQEPGAGHDPLAGSFYLSGR